MIVALGFSLACNVNSIKNKIARVYNIIIMILFENGIQKSNVDNKIITIKHIPINFLKIEFS